MSEPQARHLRKELRPLMDAVIPAAARLVLHLTGAAQLSPADVERYVKIISLFLEAIDDLQAP